MGGVFKSHEAQEEPEQLVLLHPKDWLEALTLRSCSPKHKSAETVTYMMLFWLILPLWDGWVVEGLSPWLHRRTEKMRLKNLWAALHRKTMMSFSPKSSCESAAGGGYSCDGAPHCWLSPCFPRCGALEQGFNPLNPNCCSGNQSRAQCGVEGFPVNFCSGFVPLEGFCLTDRHVRWNSTSQKNAGSAPVASCFAAFLSAFLRVIICLSFWQKYFPSTLPFCILLGKSVSSWLLAPVTSGSSSFYSPAYETKQQLQKILQRKKESQQQMQTWYVWSSNKMRRFYL